MLAVDPDRKHSRSAADGDGDLMTACLAYRLFSCVPGRGHRPQADEQFQRVFSGGTVRARRGAHVQSGGRLRQRAVVLLEHDVLKPPGGRLDEAHGGPGGHGAQHCTRLLRNNMIPGGPDRDAGQPSERAMPVLGRRGRDLLAYLDPGAGRRERGLDPGDDLIPGRLARRCGPAELSGGDAVGLSAGGHLRTDRLLAGTIPGHCRSFRQGPAHPARTACTCFRGKRESVTLVLVAKTSAGGNLARSGRARPPLLPR